MKIYNQHHTDKLSPESQALIATIDQHFSQLATTLRATYRGRTRRQALAQKPWILMLGPHGSGKTTLLRQATITLSQLVAPDSPVIQSWISENAVYLDVCSQAIPANEHTACWRAISRQLAQTRKQQSLNGIVLTLNLLDLISLTKLQREALLNDYKTCIDVLTDSLEKTCPVYVVYTHVDLLSGFNEYFDDLGNIERQQSFGFILEEIDRSLLETVDEQTSRLIQNLNNKLIRRLHQVHNADVRARINDFPIQMESLKDAMLESLRPFTHLAEPAMIRGCFLVSSLQKGTVQDRLMKPIEQTFALTLPNTTPAKLDSCAYFSHELMSAIVPRDSVKLTNPKQQKTNRHRHLSGHAVTMGIAALLLAGMTTTMVHELNFIRDTGQRLVTYQQEKPSLYHAMTSSDLEQQIFALLELQHNVAQLNHRFHQWLNPYPFSGYHRVVSKLKQTYQHELQTVLFPQLSQYINRTLQQTDGKQSDELFAALKAYLMMAEPQHRDAHYLSQWFNYRWSQDEKFQQLNVEHMTRALEFILNDHTVALDLDIDSISEARATLNNLPPATLALLALKTETISKQSIAHDPASEMVVDNHTIHIPYLFTKNGFHQLYDHDIGDISQAVLAGNWILGRQIPVRHTSANQLSLELKQRYLSEYVAWWQQFLMEVKMPSFSNPQAAADVFHQLGKSNSVLLNLVRLLQENTSPISSTDTASLAFNAQVSSQFRAMQTALVHLNSLTSTFRELGDSFEQIAKDPSADELAFNATAGVFAEDRHTPLAQLLASSQELPLPVNFWLSQLGNQSMDILMPKTQTYIDKQWRQQVIDEYHSNIDLHFPLLLESSEDVKLSDFNHFFAENGTLEHFYQRYLKPFINTDETTWTPRQVGEWKLPLGNGFLEQLVRANLVRQMFFDGNQPQAEVGFTLRPLHFSQGIRDVTVEINQQRLQSSNNRYQATHVFWPGQHVDGGLSVMINTDDDGKSFIAEMGPWALFHLLAKSNMKNTQGSSQFEVTLNFNGYTVSYALTADKPVNPFIMNVLGSFDLPNTITATSKTA